MQRELFGALGGNGHQKKLAGPGNQVLLVACRRAFSEHHYLVFVAELGGSGAKRTEKLGNLLRVEPEILLRRLNRVVHVAGRIVEKNPLSLHYEGNRYSLGTKDPLKTPGEIPKKHLGLLDRDFPGVPASQLGPEGHHLSSKLQENGYQGSLGYFRRVTDEGNHKETIFRRALQHVPKAVALVVNLHRRLPLDEILENELSFYTFDLVGHVAIPLLELR